LVRPLIELDDLVPVLGLVQRLTLIEPRGRHERPVLALIGPLHAVLRLERRAPPEHIAAGTLLTAAGALPRTREVRLSVGQCRRRFCAGCCLAIDQDRRALAERLGRRQAGRAGDGGLGRAVRAGPETDQALL